VWVKVLGTERLGGRGHDLVDVSGIDGERISRGLLRQVRVEVGLIGKGIARRPGYPGSKRSSGVGGMPVRGGDDTDKVVNLYHLRVAGQAGEGAFVDVLDVGTEGGWADHFAVKHAGDTNFLHVLEGAFGLGRDVHARDGLSEKLPCGGTVGHSR